MMKIRYIRLDDKIDLVLWELYGISISPARIFIEHTQMSLLKVISSRRMREGYISRVKGILKLDETFEIA